MELISSIERCDITTFKKADMSRLDDYDLIVFGSPVWGGVPPNVMRFIDAMPSLKRKHFAGLLYPRCIAGTVLSPDYSKRSRRKDLSIIGSNDWYGSVFRPAAPTPYLTDGHPDEIDLEEAEEFGREIAELSRKIYEGKTKFTPALPKMEIGPRTSLNRPVPKLNAEKCRYPSCSLCMDHCPVGAIDLSVSPPVFARACSFCYFCEMICPEGAVEADYSAYAEVFRQHAREKFVKVLEEAEKEGTFQEARTSR